MTTSREFLTMPLTRKFGSMPSLAQKSIISLDYKDEGFTPRKVSDPPKSGTRQSGTHESLELPQVRWSLVIPAKNVHSPNSRQKIAWRSPLLEQRQNAGVDQQSVGETITPNKEKTAAGSPGKRRLNENATFLLKQHSEWLGRVLPFNERLNGVKKADSSLKTRAQITGQGKVTNTGQNTKLKGIQVRKSQIRRKIEVPKKAPLTTNKDAGKYSRAISVEREFYFQDYRQKCIQWLKSLPDSGTHPMNLR
ncbi:uncharacterized protein LOC110042322 [Orbicella faveolata]|uniref:uncharacterized protein LOC110042322 n=1 Tax=Orbicella faveolata TaxID=48498 RepID=UPI0009E428C3|nr:uncharacterized protein LOC110042322 [Orbicella faveolata]